MADNDSTSSTTRDSILTDIYAPRATPNLQHLLSETSHIRNTAVVKDTDYDEMVVAEAAARSAPVAPSGPTVGGPLDITNARTSVGERITSHANLTEETIVTYDGMETTVGALVSLGLVARDPGTGLFSSVTAGPETQPQTPQPEANPSLDDHSEAFIAEASEKAPGEAMAAAVEAMSNDGVVSAETVSRLASQLGIEPSEAESRVTHVRAAYHQEAVTSGAKAAGTSESIAVEALAHARANNLPALRQAAEGHFTTGQPDYGPFVRDFVADLDQIDPRRILDANPIAGRQTRWDALSRQVIVTLDTGAEWAWGDAVRAGLISFR